MTNGVGRGGEGEHCRGGLETVLVDGEGEGGAHGLRGIGVGLGDGGDVLGLSLCLKFYSIDFDIRARLGVCDRGSFG